MNIIQITAVLFGLAVTIGGFYLTTNTPQMFLDGTSVFIVIGGTIAATAISVKIPTVWSLLKLFFKRFLSGKSVDYKMCIEEIISLSNSFYRGESMEIFLPKIKDPFLKESIELYTEDLLDQEHLITILTDRRRNMHKKLMMSVSKFKNIGKYPPAFGMMGTTMGMIVLLGNLGGKDAMKTIGPAMAVCLITTLYGVILSNMFIVPISENIESSVNEINLKNEIIIHGLFLALQKTPPAIIAEELNSYLDIEERLDWKDVLSHA